MNSETDYILQFFKLRTNDELFILTGSIEDKSDGVGE